MKIFKRQITLLDIILGGLVLAIIFVYIHQTPKHTDLTKCLLSDLEKDVWVENYFYYEHKNKQIKLEVSSPYSVGYLTYNNGEKIQLTKDESIILDKAIGEFIDTKRKKKYEAEQKQVKDENDSKINKFLKQCGN